MKRTLIACIAGAISARLNCIARGNAVGLEIHEENLRLLAGILPSGSGIDNGTAIDWEKSRGDCIVLEIPFHHMDEHGFYDGWEHYTMRVRPDFDDVNITIPGGRDRNDIKDYLAEMYQYALTRVYEHAVDGYTLVGD